MFVFLLSEEDGNTAKNPLVCGFLGLEVERPDVVWSSVTCLVNWALVYVLCFESILIINFRLSFYVNKLTNWNRLDKENGHGWSEFLELRLVDTSGRSIPSSAFHEKSMDVSTFSWRGVDIVL